MKKHALIAFAALAVAGGSVLAFAPVQTEKLDAKSLKRTLEGLGYELKALEEAEGKEMYEFKSTADGYDVFMAAQISPSKNYVWLTVYFGEMAKRDKKADIYKNLLVENGKIQPCQFYITSSNALKMALPIDNRGIQAADLKRNIDSLAGNVADTVELWREDE